MNKKIVAIGTTIGIILVLIVVILLMNHISKSETMICTFTHKNDIATIHTEYNITHKDNVVTNLKTIEKIESDDTKMLEEYKISL